MAIVMDAHAQQLADDSLAVSTFSRIITKLVEMYGLFKVRIQAIGKEEKESEDIQYDGTTVVASTLILDRVARINIDVLYHKVSDNGLLQGWGASDSLGHLPANWEDYPNCIRSKAPLHIAVELGSIEMVKLLVSKGDVESKTTDDSKITPLHVAARNGRLEILEFLLSQHADIEARSQNQKTPLILAASEGSLEAVRYLLGKGADISSADTSGLTALHWATISSRTDVLKLLLKFQPDIMARSLTGSTALHCATNFARDGTIECIDVLVDAGIDVNAVDHIMETALHKASQRGNLVAVEHLLKKGASLSAEAPTGTPLHHTVSVWSANKRLSIVQRLLEYSCARDTNIRRTSDGRTPLHAAVRNLDTFGQTNLKIIELLCAHGADLDIKDYDSKSALDHAEEHEAGSRLLKQYLPQNLPLYPLNYQRQVDINILHLIEKVN
ncbi:MAG: hypothetical protein Q9166_003716 [cf. Caloplaca sp. 2 TL-2023]